MAAVGAFFIDPITPLAIEDVPQILLNRRRSLAVLGRWTRSSPPLSELPLKLTDDIVLLLDNKVLGLDIRKERVVVAIGVGLVMGT